MRRKRRYIEELSSKEINDLEKGFKNGKGVIAYMALYNQILSEW